MPNVIQHTHFSTTVLRQTGEAMTHSLLQAPVNNRPRFYHSKVMHFIKGYISRYISSNNFRLEFAKITQA